MLKFIKKIFTTNNNQLENNYNCLNINSENKIQNIDYNQEFKYAIYENNSNYINSLLYLIDRENINIYEKDETETTYLMVLCKNKNYKLVEKFFHLYNKDKLFENNIFGYNAFMYLVFDNINIKKKEELYFIMNIFLYDLLVVHLDEYSENIKNMINQKNGEGLNIIYYIVKNNLDPHKYINLFIDYFQEDLDFDINDEYDNTILNLLLELELFDIAERIIDMKKGVIEKSNDGLKNIKLLLKNLQKKNNNNIKKYLLNYDYHIDELFDKTNKNKLDIKKTFINNEDLLIYFLDKKGIDKIINIENFDIRYNINRSELIYIMKKYNIYNEYESLIVNESLNLFTYSLLFYSKKTTYRLWKLIYKNANIDLISKYNYLIYQNLLFCILTKNENIALNYLKYIENQNNQNNNLKMYLQSKYKNEVTLLLLSCKHNMEELSKEIINLSPYSIFEVYTKSVKIQNIENIKGKRKNTKEEVVKKYNYDILDICCKNNLVEVVELIIKYYFLLKNDDYLLKNNNYLLKNLRSIVKKINKLTKKNEEKILSLIHKYIADFLNLPNDLMILMFEYLYF